MTENREREVVEAFVSIANSLIGPFDVIELLDELTSECAQLLDVGSAGLLLADRRGVLHVAAATSERTRALELLQLQRDEGPCLDCYRTGEPVKVADLSSAADRWPQFVQAATLAGFNSVHAIPMRLLDDVLGALGLFSNDVGELGSDDLRLGQALAHVATVAIIAGNAASDLPSVMERLEQVLHSRVLVEQAKGLLAEIGALDIEQAFTSLRVYARAHDQRLTDVAHELVTRRLRAEAVLEHRASGGARRARSG